MTTTTTAQSVSASNSSNICLEKLPDYVILRKNNMSQINQYYEDLLTNYSTNYTDYVKNNSGNVSDRSYAETQLKPKTLNYNNQMISLNQKMIDSINEDTNNILELKNQLDDKILQIDKLKQKQKQLRDDADSLEIEYKSRRDNLNITKKGLHSIKLWNYGYITVNIILVIAILCLLIYLIFFKNSTAPQLNTSTSASTTSTSITTTNKSLANTKLMNSNTRKNA
jgi:hypothetical protein